MGNFKGLIISIGVVLLIIFVFFAVRSGDLFLSTLAGTVLIGLVIVAAIVIAIVVIVVWLAFFYSDDTKKSNTKEPVPVIDPTVKSTLDGGRKTLLALRMTVRRIENDTVRETGDIVCTEVDKLLKTLTEKPEAFSKARRYLSYYLPTLDKILRKYKEMEQNRVLPDGMTEALLDCLADIRSATEKQHRNLYEADVLDLTAEIEVMTAVCKNDGLLTDEDDNSKDVGLKQ